MGYTPLCNCPALKALVRLDSCQDCQHHVEGISCKYKGAFPKSYCLQECKHNQSGTCTHPQEQKRAEKKQTECREASEVWEETPPMCRAPRLIAMTKMYTEGEEV